MRTAVVLPGTVRPEQGEDAALGHPEVQAGQRPDLPVMLDQALRLDNGRTRPSSRLSQSFLLPMTSYLPYGKDGH